MSNLEAAQKQLATKCLYAGLDVSADTMTGAGLARLVELGYATQESAEIEAKMDLATVQLARDISDRETSEFKPILSVPTEATVFLHSVSDLLLLMNPTQLGLLIQYIERAAAACEITNETADEISLFRQALRRGETKIRRLAVKLRAALEGDIKWQLAALEQSIDLKFQEIGDRALEYLFNPHWTPQWLWRRSQYWEGELKEKTQTFVDGVTDPTFDLESALAKVGTDLCAAPFRREPCFAVVLDSVIESRGMVAGRSMVERIVEFAPATACFHLVSAALQYQDLVPEDSLDVALEGLLRLTGNGIDMDTIRSCDQPKLAAKEELDEVALKAVLYDYGTRHFLYKIELACGGESSDWALYEASRLANRLVAASLKFPRLVAWLIGQFEERAEAERHVAIIASSNVVGTATRLSFAAVENLWTPACLALLQRWSSLPNGKYFSKDRRHMIFLSAQRALAVFGVPGGDRISKAETLLPDLLLNPSTWTEAFGIELATAWAEDSFKYATQYASWDQVLKGLQEVSRLAGEDAAVLFSVFGGKLERREWDSSDVISWLESEPGRECAVHTRDADLGRLERLLQALLLWARPGSVGDRQAVGRYMYAVYSHAGLSATGQKIVLTFLMICAIKWKKLHVFSEALHERGGDCRLVGIRGAANVLANLSRWAPTWLQSQVRAARVMLASVDSISEVE